MSSIDRTPALLLPLLTMIAIIATFVVNVWSNIAPIFGQTIGEISNTEFANVLIVPANYAFAIWGLIYLGLFGFGIYQLLREARSNPRLQQVRPLLILACVAQAVWVFLFLSRQFWLSVVAMLLILLPLIGCYLKLGVGRSVNRGEQWLAHRPFSLYLGWISVATIVNIAIALYSQNWNGWGLSAASWTQIMMGAAGVIGVAVALRHRDPVYPLVITWALLAIAIRHLSMPSIAVPAVVWAIGVAIGAGLQVKALKSVSP